MEQVAMRKAELAFKLLDIDNNHALTHEELTRFTGDEYTRMHVHALTEGNKVRYIIDNFKDVKSRPEQTPLWI